MKDRILEVIKSSELGQSEFANRIGISPSALHHILNGRNKPSLDFVLKLHDCFPEIDLIWLLTGENGERKKTFVSQQELSFQFDEVDKIANNKREVDKQSSEPISITIPTPPSQIEEIRVFFSDGRFEVFKPVR